MGFTSVLTNVVSKIGGPQSVKAVLVIIKDSPEQIPVQFNPSEYTISDSATYDEKIRRKKNDSIVSFNGKPRAVLSVKLYFNVDEMSSVGGLVSGAVNLITGNDTTKDITATLNKIASLTEIDGVEHQPPGVAFVWGSLQFLGYTERVSVNYTMFDKSGKPLRAVVDLTIRGRNGSSSEKNSPFMSPDRTKARTMTEDINIWNIAEKEYGDVQEWRRIEDANDIMNPLDIPVGKVLRVPSID